MLFNTLYLGNSAKDKFDDIKKRVKNGYVLNKAEYPRDVTGVQNLLLDYQPDNNSNGQSQYQGVINQIIFTQHEKTGDDEG